MVRVAATFGLICFLVLVNLHHMVADEADPVVVEAPKPLLILEIEQYKNLQTQHLDKLESVLIPEVKPLRFHWQVSKKNPRARELIELLNKALEDLRKNGRFQVLKDKYLKPEAGK